MVDETWAAKSQSERPLESYSSVGCSNQETEGRSSHMKLWRMWRCRTQQRAPRTEKSAEMIENSIRRSTWSAPRNCTTSTRPENQGCEECADLAGRVSVDDDHWRWRWWSGNHVRVSEYVGGDSMKTRLEELTDALEWNRAIDPTGAHSAAHRGADWWCPSTGRGRNGRSGPDHSPGAYLRVYHRLNRPYPSGDATPRTDRPDSSEDSESSTSADSRLSGRRARCDAAESANVTRHRVCLARCSDHARRTKLLSCWGRGNDVFVVRQRRHINYVWSVSGVKLPSWRQENSSQKLTTRIPWEMAALKRLPELSEEHRDGCKPWPDGSCRSSSFGGVLWSTRRSQLESGPCKAGWHNPSWWHDSTGSRAEGREGVRAGGASDYKECGRMQEWREYDETSRQRWEF